MLLRDELSLSIGASPARASPKSSTSTKEDELTKLGFRVILFLTTRVLSILVQVFTDLTWLSSSEFFSPIAFFSTCLRSFFFRNPDLEFHLIRTNKHFLFVQKKLRKKLLERKKSFWAELCSTSTSALIFYFAFNFFKTFPLLVSIGLFLTQATNFFSLQIFCWVCWHQRS